jgi:acyl-coenzyme A thioesterase PaaI-like protein
MDRSAFFWQIQDGRLPPPRAAVTLGISIREVSPEAGTIEVEFEGKPEFTNPAGHIQGGFLAAMLDDTMGPALAATLGRRRVRAHAQSQRLVRSAGQGRQAQGKGRIVRRGKDICFLAAELFQDGELVASATATAMVRRHGRPTAASR